MSQLCSECRTRPIYIPKSLSRARNGMRGKVRQQHDLCRQCFKSLLTRLKVA